MFVERCGGMVRRSVRQKWFPPEPRETSAAVNKIIKKGSEESIRQVGFVLRGSLKMWIQIPLHLIVISWWMSWTKVHPFLWFDVEIKMSGAESEGKWYKNYKLRRRGNRDINGPEHCIWETKCPNKKSPQQAKQLQEETERPPIQATRNSAWKGY